LAFFTLIVIQCNTLYTRYLKHGNTITKLSLQLYLKFTPTPKIPIAFYPPFDTRYFHHAMLLLSNIRRLGDGSKEGCRSH
jgi:hypothetical protein